MSLYQFMNLNMLAGFTLSQVFEYKHIVGPAFILLAHFGDIGLKHYIVKLLWYTICSKCSLKFNHVLPLALPFLNEYSVFFFFVANPVFVPPHNFISLYIF